MLVLEELFVVLDDAARLLEPDWPELIVRMGWAIVSGSGYYRCISERLRAVSQDSLL